jgi:hypothetical protein
MNWLALFVSLVLLVAAAKKAKHALGRGGAIMRHITKLEQSRFSADIYACFVLMLPMK